MRFRTDMSTWPCCRPHLFDALPALKDNDAAGDEKSKSAFTPIAVG
jgi:hypothetical protein